MPCTMHRLGKDRGRRENKGNNNDREGLHGTMRRKWMNEGNVQRVVEA